MKILRPFQATAVTNACAFVCEVAEHDEWTGKQRRRLFAAPTGSGKTLCELEILKWAVGAGLDAWIVTPSLEIVRGMLSQLGVENLPTGDDALADLAETHKISTPTRLRNRCLDGRKAVPDLWLIDECFPAGTLVGGVPIETVKVGDQVASFTEDRLTPVSRRVTRLFRSQPSALVTVHFTNGRTLTCTPNHPVLTGAGRWVAAGALTSDSVVLGFTDYGEDVGRPMRGVRGSAEVGGAPRLHGGEAGLRALPGEAGRGEVGLHEATVLTDGERDEHPVCVGAHEGEEPHAQGGRPGRGHVEGSAPRLARGSDSRWERAASTRPAAAPRDGAWVADGGRREDGDPAAHLQDRRGEPRAEAGDRGGRPESLAGSPEGRGPAQGSRLAAARVDRVEVHEPGGDGTFGGLCPDGLVYNLEVEGTHTYVADGVAVHNCHHAIEQNEVSGCNFALAPASAWIGFTATDYRGTPAGTAALREAWGEPVRLLTYPQAIEHGFVALPKVEVIPLLDDDHVKIVNGEFQEKAASKAVVDKIGALATLIARWWEPQRGGSPPGSMDTPTCVAVPSTDAVGSLVSALDALGVDSVPVTQSTKPADRVAAFELCRQRRAVLVQIKVVSEGVDLPWLGRIVDARPLVSPVAWLQWFGRVTRPYPHVTKHYVCTNRNLERHAYLLQGALPRSAVAQAQAAFLGPSKRGAGRVVGLESLGRLKPIELPLAGGVQSSAYMVYSVDEKGVKHEWSVLFDPCHERPITAYRCLHPTGNAEQPWDYKGEGAKWTLREMPSDFSGFATSAARGSLSEKQAAWWKRAAHRYGLDSDAEVSMRSFQALPVLKDLGLTLAAQPVAGEAS